MPGSKLWRSLQLGCLATSLCFCQTPEPAALSEPVLTLNEALAMAVRQNTQNQISDLSVSGAMEQTNQIRSQRLPLFKVLANGGGSLAPIDLTIPQGTLGTYAATGPIPAEDATIRTPQRFNAFIYGSVAQPVTQLFKIGLALRESRVGEQIAKEKVRQQTQVTAQQVKQAYSQITQIQSQIASGDVSLQYLRELSGYTQRRLAENTALKSDELSVKARLSQQEYQLLTLRNDLDTQKETLNRLLGRDLRTGFSVQMEPALAEDEISLPAAQRRALEQRPEMRQAQLQTHRTELEVRREHAEYIPDLSLHFSYLSFPNVNFLPKNVLNAGFLLEWQPFDWGFKKSKIAELRTTSKQTALNEKQEQQQILIEVNSSYRKLAEARALLGVEQSSQEAEREKLRVVTNRYQEQSALLTDVLQQQTSVAQADARYHRALADFWTARAAFERALGE